MEKMEKMIKILCLFLWAFILTGCFDEARIADYIEEHFQTHEYVIYHDPIISLNPDHIFSFEMSQEVYGYITNLNGYALEDIFTVFTDVGLTKRIDTHPTFEQNMLTIAPSYSRRAFGENDIYFSEGDTWGYFSHYYLVQNFDLDTGERLQIPSVTVFTIDRYLASPILSIIHEKDNSFTLSWDEVQHAEAYYLVRIEFIDEFNFEVHVIDTTTATSWNSEIDGQHLANVNAEIFSYYTTSKDQQIATNATFWWDIEGALSRGNIFGVVAREGDQFSNLSFFREDKIDRDMVICEAASFAMDEVMSALDIETIEQIPGFLPVTACSGDTINAQIILDIDHVSWQDEILHVPYEFHDSTVRGYFTIINANTDTYQEDLIARQEEMEELFNQNIRHDYRYQSTRVVAFDARSSSTLPEVSDTIFSTSELETFIVTNMIDGAAIIDISYFDWEDTSYVAIFELLDQIRYQNPMVLQFRGFRYDSQNKVIFVHFLYDPETRAEIQQMIRNEVSSVANEIITPNMSDAERVYAINQFIIDNTVYHDAAYESLRNNQNRYFYDETYFYASTAGGVFIQGYAVCEGYSAALMLLTDYIGIQSIAVTGHTVDDPGRHMWNRVLIDDQWYIVDPTHNANGHVPNSVLLLADDIADQIYIEDTFFLIDRKLNDYRAPGPSIHEYYYSHGLAVTSVLEGIDLLVYLLQTQNSAAIRLPIDTTEAQFDQIGQAIADHFQRGLIYYHFNGVIHIIFQ